MSFKKFLMIMMIFIVAMGISAVSADDSTADNDIIINEGDGAVAVSQATDFSQDIVNDTTDNGVEKVAVQDSEDNEQSSLANGVAGDVKSIVGENITKYFKNDTQYYATLFDASGSPLNGVKAEVTINGQTYNRTTNASGKIKFNVNLPAGNYIITVKNPVTNETISNSVIVLPTLKGENIEKYFKNGTQYYITTLNGQGKPLAGVNLTININGQFYKRTTKEDGKAKFDINLPAGTYTITVSNPVNGEITSNNVTVLPTVFVKNVNKYFKNNTQYYIEVIGNQGKPLSGAKLSINVNGQFYNRTTNASGVAKFDINLPPGKYTVTVRDKNTDAVASSTVNVLATLSVKNLSKYYKSDDQYYITVLDGQGKPLGGAKLSINVNGLYYNRTSNESGIAKFNINLPAGKYTVTVTDTSNGAVASSTVTVSATLVGTSFSKYIGNDTPYVIKTLDAQGKPLGNISVKININGVIYNRTTNENGTAKLNINLPIGKYTLTVTNPLNGEIISNEINVLSRIVAITTGITYNSNGAFKYKIVDSAGKGIANQTTYVVLNGNTYKRTTGADGSASVTVNFPVGKYKTIVLWNDTSQEFNVSINKRSVTITIVSSTVKSGDYYKCKVSDNGKPVEGLKVYFVYDFDSQKYAMAGTDAQGIAQVKIDADPGSYQFYVGIQDDPIYSNTFIETTLTVKA